MEPVLLGVVAPRRQRSFRGGILALISLKFSVVIENQKIIICNLLTVALIWFIKTMQTVFDRRILR